jgi:hypothetical protein
LPAFISLPSDLAEKGHEIYQMKWAYQEELWLPDGPRSEADAMQKKGLEKAG